ncbi:hypothetical protein Unana1_04792 [Umbelopsis nana]
MSNNNMERNNNLAQPLSAMSIHAITNKDDDTNDATSGDTASSSSNHAVLESDNIYSPRNGTSYVFDSTALLEPLPSWDASDGFRRYSSAAESSTSNHDESNASTSSSTPQVTPSATRYAQDIPLSLAERRQRNKAASAKYRAKKHAATAQMSQQINELFEENARLQQQLDDAQKETQRLEDRCEELQRHLSRSSSAYHNDAGDEASSSSPHESKKRKGVNSRTTASASTPSPHSISKSSKGKSRK